MKSFILTLLVFAIVVTAENDDMPDGRPTGFMCHRRRGECTTQNCGYMKDKNSDCRRPQWCCPRKGQRKLKQRR